MARKKTNEEFIKKVYDLVGDEYMFLEEYKGVEKNILCRHSTCQYEWSIRPNNFLNGKRCPKCFGSPKKTTSQFVCEVYELVKEEYIVLGEYVNAHTKIKIKHSSCGCEWDITPNSFLNGTRCPRCAGLEKLTYQEVKHFVEVKSNSGCKLLSKEYKNCRTKMLFKCGCKSGNEFETTLINFQYGNKKQCNECSGKVRKDTDYFKQEVYDLTGDEYEVVGEYIGSKSKVRIKHNIDNCNGHEWDITPDNFLNGNRCPQCNESKGEEKIRKCLESKKRIKFKQEYSFAGLVGVGGGLLRFDFAIFNSNDSLNCLIEYDGEFHYKDIYEDGSFKDIQIHDERKNHYCKQNNIPLLRIPYWEFDNVENILNQWLEEIKNYRGN